MYTVCMARYVGETAYTKRSCSGLFHPCGSTAMHICGERSDRKSLTSPHASLSDPGLLRHVLMYSREPYLYNSMNE